MDEGYIKFTCHWIPGDALSESILSDLNAWRQRLYQVGLLGAYPDGIGFGNVSKRIDAKQFVITGSATGNFEELTSEHYSLVESVAVDQNAVWCSGPIRASAESMTHAAVYATAPQVKAVFHVHSLVLWNRYLNEIPTTDEKALYGSPEMYHEIQRLINEFGMYDSGVLVMAGHEEGLIGYGMTLAEAGAKILKLLK